VGWARSPRCAAGAAGNAMVAGRAPDVGKSMRKSWEDSMEHDGKCHEAMIQILELVQKNI